MGITLLFWFFGLFIYNKVAFDLGYYSDITVLASLLIALVQTGLIFWVTAHYATKLLRFNAFPGTVTLESCSEIIKPTIWAFLLCYSVNLILSRIIIFGFSKKLTREIEFFTYRSDLSEEGTIFLLIILLPVLLHYVLVVSGTYFNTKSETKL